MDVQAGKRRHIAATLSLNLTWCDNWLKLRILPTLRGAVNVFSEEVKKLELSDVSIEYVVLRFSFDEDPLN